MTKKILITNGYSDSNKGDLAITLGTIEALKSAFTGAHITLQSVYSKKDPQFDFHNRFVRAQLDAIQEMIIPSPYVESAKSSLASHLLASMRLTLSYLGLFLHLVKLSSLTRFLNKNQDESINEFYTADLVVMKGGQYIYNDQGGVRGFLYLIRMLTPLFLRKDIIIMGQSIGPIQGKLSKSLTKLALKRAKSILAREQKTIDYLKSDLGVFHNVQPIPDMAFFFSTEIASVSVQDGPPLIGITVVNWYFPGEKNIEKCRESYAEKIAITVNTLNKENSYNFVFIPQVTVEHHGESDLQMIDKIVRKLDADVEHSVIKEDLSIDKILKTYKKCRLLIGTRLHSCILALCANTPVIAIRYQGFKTEGIMRSLGLEHNVIEINNFTAEQLTMLINKAISGADTFDVTSKTKDHKERISNCALQLSE